ncbi:MAG TPA: hypothetical protein VKA37_10290, partial [Halobacteriales archaeon]|nr:hypothetical protein [Halobacteriales archaeon]
GVCGDPYVFEDDRKGASVGWTVPGELAVGCGCDSDVGRDREQWSEASCDRRGTLGARSGHDWEGGGMGG